MSEAILGARWRARVAGSKDIIKKAEAEAGVRYPTGFLNIDFLNGCVIHVIDINTHEEIMSYNSLGILDGSYCLFVGRSASGKTTLALQIAGNIIRPFKTSSIIHDDVEGGIEDTRKYQIMGMSPQEAESGRYIQRNYGVTAESFYERLKEIYDERMENRDDYLYDTGYVDMINRKIYKLEPCVYILDSLAMLSPEEYAEEDELSGQMSATKTAKVNNQIFRKIVPMIKTVNIILFVINHIMEDVSLRPKKPALAFLKMGETLPGGRDQAYCATNIFRVDDVEKLKETEGYKIPGAIIELSFVKARTTFNGRSTKLVNDFNYGFDPQLSLLQMLKDEKVLTGSAAFPSLAGKDNMKFTYATFRQKLADNVEMQQVFAEECYKILSTYITDKRIDTSITDATININNIIFGMNPVQSAA